MTVSSIRGSATASVVVLTALALAGCNTAQRLADVGQAPEMTHPQNPTQLPGYEPVVMPMPSPRAPSHNANSLWRAGSRAFLKDQRAANVGDILTVVIEIDDSASIRNNTSRDRAGSEGLGLPHMMGFESQVRKILPSAADNENLVSTSSNSSSEGSGQVRRGEDIQVSIAALVTQVLPNGNLVIQGRQEVRVNYELRELLVAGVIRPEDISATNTIPYDKIAEARISYGGRGQITDMQQPRYGQQVLDIILPF